MPLASQATSLIITDSWFDSTPSFGLFGVLSVSSKIVVVTSLLFPLLSPITTFSNSFVSTFVIATLYFSPLSAK